MLRIGVVEDHPRVQEALQSAFTHSEGFDLLPPCRDQDEGLRLVQAHCPDVLLVDLCLPRGGDGVKVIRAASQLWAGRCVSAVLTVARHEEYWLDAIHAGAKGFVQKDESAAAWRTTVQRLAAGHSPMSADLARLLFAELRQRSHPASKCGKLSRCLSYLAAGYSLEELSAPLGLNADQAGVLARQAYDACVEMGPHLSAREAQLLALLGFGLSLKACAVSMGISETTVKTYAQRMYEKLGTSNRQAAVAIAQDLCLLP